MESNSDKQMRDKLQGFEAPYDPAAWQAMSALLDQKKKRRGFFWWWMGGSVAAVFLVSAFLLINAPTSSEKNKLAQNQQSAELKAETKTTETVVSESFNEPATHKATGNEAAISDMKAAAKQKTKSATAAIRHNNTPRRKLKQQEALAAAAPEEMPFVHNTEASKSSPFAAFEVTDENALQNRLAEAALLQQARAQQSASATEQQTAAADENSLQKIFNAVDSSAHEDKPAEKPTGKKQFVFHYQLGAAANITATSVGAQSINGKNNLLYGTPSFAAGLSQEFLFMNRFAITTGLMYAQTGFRIEQPDTDTSFAGGSTYNHYTSKISELNVPVGIKVYPYVSETLKVFAHTGIVNHIKLQEVFVSNITSPQAIVNVPPGQTLLDGNNFTNANANPFGELSGITTTALEKTITTGEADFFGIRGQKRYYTSFFASCGLEVVLRKRLHIVAEPMYQLLLHKIGRQQNLKHNFGLSAGVKWMFGR